MRSGKRPSPHVLPGVALVLIALSVLVQVVLRPDLSRPWLSSPAPQTGPGATPTAAPPPQIGAPADVLTEAAETIRDAGAGHGPYAPGGYAERYAAGHLGQIAGGAGATYYIAITGTDTANTTCTLASPCASLTHFGVGQGGPTVLPGDTIDILAGQYNLAYTGVTTPTEGTTGLWDWNGVAGTVAQPITIQGIGAVTVTRETPASVWDQQAHLLTIRQTGGGAVAPTYITVANLTFIGMTARGDYIPSAILTLDPGGNYDGTGMSEIQFINPTTSLGFLFDHVTVRDTADGCVKGGIFSTVQYSRLVTCGTGNIAHAVYASGGNATLTHNVVQNGAGASLYTDDFHNTPMTITDNVVSQQGISTTLSTPGIQTSTGGSIVARNVVYDSWCGGIAVGRGLPTSIDAAHPITVEQNVVANWNVNQTTTCVGLAYSSPGFETVRNNSFWGHGLATQMINGSPTGPMIVENNIFAAGSATTNYICMTGQGGAVEDYNLYFHVLLSPSCSTVHGAHDVNGGASTDPLYWAAPDVLPGSMTPFVALPDLHLQAGSPARGAGTDVGYGTDLGAYPYVAPPPTALPTAPPSSSGGTAPSTHAGHRR